MIKIVTIVGARPQFIKAAVVSRALQAHDPAVQELLVHAGQHYDANMSDVFLEDLSKQSREHLAVPVTPIDVHARITARSAVAPSTGKLDSEGARF